MTFSRLPRTIAALALAAGLGLVGACSSPTTTQSATASAVADETVTVLDADGQIIEFAYPGRTGATALELLREYDPQAAVTGEGADAFVTGIMGREADQAAQQFWALYVDGEFAQVGAGSLETEDGQTVTWKLETWE